MEFAVNNSLIVLLILYDEQAKQESMIHLSTGCFCKVRIRRLTNAEKRVQKLIYSIKVV